MITDYNTLITALKRWAQNADLDADGYDEFVQLTETHLNSVLRIESMTARFRQLTKPNFSFYEQPDDAIGIRNIEIEWNGRRFPLGYYTPEALDSEYGHIRNNGVPEAYTLSGKEIELRPCPSGEFPIKILYYRRIPSINLTNPTNWLIQRYPNTYLYGGLHFLAVYIRDDEAAAMWSRKFDAAIEGIREEDATDRWSGATMMARVI